MKKLLSIFLSFSLIFSLVMVKNSSNENQIVYAEDADFYSDSASGCGDRVERKFWPLLQALVGMTVKVGCFAICAVFYLGWAVLRRVFCSVVDMFTDGKAKETRRLTEENQRLKNMYENSISKFVKVLSDNKNSKKYVETLINDFLAAENKLDYINSI